MRNPYDWLGRLGMLLAIIGAINWLLVGLFQYNLVKAIFTSSGTQDASTGERIVYIVVGVGGVLAIPMLAATLGRARGRRTDYGYGDTQATGGDLRSTGTTTTEDQLEEERRRRAA